MTEFNETEHAIRQLARDPNLANLELALAALAKLKEAWSEMDRLNRQAVCVYCGHVAELESRGDLQRVMAEHIATCAKHPINRIVEITEPLEQQIATLTREKAELSEQMEFDRCAVADCISKANRAIDSRHWLTEGRGSYEWNDDKWQDEFRSAALEIKASLEPLTKIAADWTGCPQTSAGAAKARIDLKQQIATLTAELADARQCAARRKEVADAADVECLRREKQVGRLSAELDEAREKVKAAEAHGEQWAANVGYALSASIESEEQSEARVAHLEGALREIVAHTKRGATVGFMVIADIARAALSAPVGPPTAPKSFNETVMDAANAIYAVYGSNLATFFRQAGVSMPGDAPAEPPNTPEAPLTQGERTEILAVLEPFARAWDGMKYSVGIGEYRRAHELHARLSASPAPVVADRATGAPEGDEGNEGREGIPHAEPSSPTGKNGAPEDPSDAEMLSWIAANCKGAVRGTDITRWCVESDSENADLRTAIRAAMRKP